MTIHADPKHLAIIKHILKKYPYTFYAYGSRTKGTQRPTSDLDICFKEPISYPMQAIISEEFEESNLPFRVDLTDFNLMSTDFQKAIAQDLIEI